MIRKVSLIPPQSRNVSIYFIYRQPKEISTPPMGEVQSKFHSPRVIKAMKFQYLKSYPNQIMGSIMSIYAR